MPHQKPTHLSSKPSTPPSTRHPSPPRQSPPAAQPYQSAETSLALSPTPTLLYTSPDHSLFVLGSYLFGTFCISYAAYNFNAHYLHPPPDLAAWVPIAFGTICFGMTCLGTWLLLGPARLVKSLTAIPIRTTPPSLHIRIEARSALPFLKARVHTVPCSSLSLSHPLSAPSYQPSPEQLREESRRIRAEDKERILTAPFRHMNHAIGKALAGLGRVWTREGFVRLYIEGKSGAAWKVDRAGWVGGVDRVVRSRIR